MVLWKRTCISSLLSCNHVVSNFFFIFTLYRAQTPNAKGRHSQPTPHTQKQTNKQISSYIYIYIYIYIYVHSLYHSPNIVRVIKSRRLRWAGHVARMEEGRSAFKVLTGKPTGKRPLGRPRCRWEDIIRMNIRETDINARNWVYLAQDRDYWRALVNAPLNLSHKPWSYLVT